MPVYWHRGRIFMWFPFLADTNSFLYRNESYFHGRDDSVHSQIAMNKIHSCKEYFCLF